jgi:hypothetical protein
MRCLFSQPELLKGTRLVQVGSWIALSIVKNPFEFKLFWRKYLTAS